MTWLTTDMSQALRKSRTPEHTVWCAGISTEQTSWPSAKRACATFSRRPCGRTHNASHFREESCSNVHWLVFLPLTVVLQVLFFFFFFFFFFLKKKKSIISSIPLSSGMTCMYRLWYQSETPNPLPVRFALFRLSRGSS